MKYDVAIIGSGPGGYVAAIRCSQLGMKTAVVERYPSLGGTCLNVGCIPTKTLLESSEHFHDAAKNFKKHGIEIEGLKLNFETMMNRKKAVVAQNCKGVQTLVKKNRIDTFTGHATFEDAHQITLTKDDGSTERIQMNNAIIATGSKPFSLPTIEIDKKRIITSTEALSLPRLPESLIVIGAGVIGLELGSVYARLGTRVQILEIADSILPIMDRSTTKELQRSLKKSGLKFHLSHQVQNATNTGQTAVVTALDKRGKEIRLEAEYCLTAVGRKPFTQNLGLNRIGIETDEKGAIPVNDRLQTTLPNIYAVGDVVRGPMLAHKASEEGVFAAETIAGLKPHLNYDAIPSVVYTAPEAAGVGRTEEELIAEGRKYKSGSCPIRALGRAHTADKLDGLVKVLADAESGLLLGIHLVAPRAADIVAEAVVALETKADTEQIARASHAHPSFAEAVKEACLMAGTGQAIHVLEGKKALTKK